MGIANQLRDRRQTASASSTPSPNCKKQTRHDRRIRSRRLRGPRRAAEYPQNGYRNGTLYASYTAAKFSPARDDLAARRRHQSREGAITWAFEFEEHAPLRRLTAILATGGIDKPVLNVFRMFAS